MIERVIGAFIRWQDDHPSRGLPRHEILYQVIMLNKTKALVGDPNPAEWSAFAVAQLFDYLQDQPQIVTLDDIAEFTATAQVPPGASVVVTVPAAAQEWAALSGSVLFRHLRAVTEWVGSGRAVSRNMVLDDADDRWWVDHHELPIVDDENHQLVEVMWNGRLTPCATGCSTTCRCWPLSA